MIGWGSTPEDEVQESLDWRVGFRTTAWGCTSRTHLQLLALDIHVDAGSAFGSELRFLHCFCRQFGEVLQPCPPLPALGSATGGEQSRAVPWLLFAVVGAGDVSFPAALVCTGMSTGAELSDGARAEQGPEGRLWWMAPPSTAALLRMTKCLLGQLSRVRAALLPQTQLQPVPGMCSLYLLALNHAWADLPAATEPAMKWLFPSSRRLSHLRHSWDSSFQCRTKDSASCC